MGDLRRQNARSALKRGAFVKERHDLRVKIGLDEEEDLSLLDFFKYELSKIEDVQEVETYIVYRSKNLLVPYII